MNIITIQKRRVTPDGMAYEDSIVTVETENLKKCHDTAKKIWNEELKKK